MDGNSNKQFNHIHESETESDVEEIGQEDYYSITDENSSKTPSPYKSPNLSAKSNISIKSQLPPPNSYNNTTENQNIFSQILQKFNIMKNNIRNQVQNKIEPSNSPILDSKSQTKQINFTNPFSQNLPSPIQPQFNNNSTPLQQNTQQHYQQDFSSSNNLTTHGQSNPNNITSFSLHPSVRVPKFYTLQFHGYQVKFPYEKPYEAQKQLIANTLLAFKTGQNALLESPTGTGKSLALLSAALSFLETCPTIMKLYFTSRTHIQLQQLVGEFKKLPYFPQFSILASKRHLCIVPQVAKSFSPEYECKKLCEEDGCPYCNSDNNKKNGFDIEDVNVPKNNNANNSVPFEFTNRGSKPKFDIEDLKEYGRNHKICPYQLAFNIYNVSQFIFCPYNYILKANDDKNLLLDFPKNTTIAIFDEGHNIESTAREDASLTLTYKQVCDARHAAQFVPLDDSYRPLFNQVQQIQTDIINFIERKRSEYDDKFQNYNSYNRPKYLSGESFKNVFANIKDDLISTVGIQMAYWLKILGNSDKDELRDQKMYVNDTLVSFFSTCADVFLAITPVTFDFYRIVFVPDEKGDVKKDEFRLLCLKPSYLFNKINAKTRSIIITSGTLSPLESFAAELEASFPIRVSAPHVVDASQVLTISINSYQNVRITSRFSTLQSSGEEVYNALAQIVSTTLRAVPGGSLLFAPSYYTKDSIIRQWKSTNMYDIISSIKPIVEEKSNLPAPAIINEYVSFKDGALLIGVCRGKISEGLDFSDDLSRIVYVFGIPYPGFKEADVELKMKYNDIRHSMNKMYLSGQEWYTCQAFRALFQSVGRCLRHTSDYGAIVFLDERIESNIEKLPTWLKSNFFKSQTADQAKRLLSSFYQQMRTRFPSNSKISFGFTESNIPSQNSNSNMDVFSYSQKLNIQNKPSSSNLNTSEKFNTSSNPFNFSNSFTNASSMYKDQKAKLEKTNLSQNSLNQSSYSFNSNVSKSQSNSHNQSGFTFNSNKFSNVSNSFNQNIYSFNPKTKQEKPNSSNAIDNKPKFDSSSNSFNLNNSFTNSNSMNKDQKVKPENSYTSQNSLNQNFYSFNANNKQGKPNSSSTTDNKQKFDSSSYSFTNSNSMIKDQKVKLENPSTSLNSLNQNCYSFNANSKQGKPNSFSAIENKQKFDSSSYSFTNSSSIHKDQKVKQESKPVLNDDDDDDDEDDVCIIENEQEYEPKEKENIFLTKMYCSVCSSPVIKIKNLDSADFKSIKIPEFFQILDMKETKTKIMYLESSAVHQDFTANTKRVCSTKDSMIFIRRECSNCGSPLAVYVSDANENSEFKKGEILFRHDMISMKIDGTLTSLAEIASNLD